MKRSLELFLLSVAAAVVVAVAVRVTPSSPSPPCSDPTNNTLLISTPYHIDLPRFLQGVGKRNQLDAIRTPFFIPHAEFATALNASISFRPVHSGWYGVYHEEDGGWDGMVGALLRCHGHITMMMAIIPSRSSILNYSIRIKQEEVGFITGLPHEPDNKLSLAFANKVLRHLLFFILLTSIVLSILVESLKRGSGGGQLERLRRIYHSSIYLVQVLLKAILEQPEPTCSKFGGKRRRRVFKFFLALWLLPFIIFTNVIRSQLVSYVVRPSLIQPPGTFEELAQSPYRIYGAELATTSLRPEVKALNKSWGAKFLGRIEHKGFLQCVSAVQEKHTACVSYKEPLDLFARDYMTDKSGESCYVESHPEGNILKAWSAFGISPSANIKPLVDKISERLLEGGLFSKWDEEARYFHSRLGRRKSQDASSSSSSSSSSNFSSQEELKTSWDGGGVGKLFGFIRSLLLIMAWPFFIFLVEVGVGRFLKLREKRRWRRFEFVF